MPKTSRRRNAQPTQQPPEGKWEQLERRLGYILRRILQGETVNASEMEQAFPHVTKRTISNNLDAVAGLIHAKRAGDTIAIPDTYHNRARKTHVQAKWDMAYGIVDLKLVEARGPIIASTGTSVYFAYCALQNEQIGLQIVTNSLAFTERLGEKAIIHIVGGDLNPEINGLVGPVTEGSFSANYREGLIGVSAIDERGTLYIQDNSEGGLFRKLISDVITERMIVVADIFKIGRRDPWNVGTIHDTLDRKDALKIILVTNDHKSWSDELRQERADIDRMAKALNYFKELEQSYGPRFSFHQFPKAGIAEEN